MEDFIYLMTITPHDECCAQLGDVDYMNNARVEAHAYINQLLRVYGENPTGTRFEIAQCPYDQQTYIDIKFFCNDEDEQQVTYMIKAVGGCLHWDDQALQELMTNGYKLQEGRQKHNNIHAEFTVASSCGTLVADSVTGKVISRTIDEDQGSTLEMIVSFDVEEFKAHSKIETMPGHVDILGLGYWLFNGGYEPPVEDWREEFRKMPIKNPKGA